MTKVNFKRTLTDDEVNNIELEDGNFIVTAEGTAYVDYNIGRKKLGVGDKEYIYFTESTTLNDLVIKSNLLGNNSKINASEIVIINSDNSVKNLDDYLEETNKFSTTEEIFTGKYWVDGKPIYRKVWEIGASSTINQDISVSATITNLDKVVDFRGGVYFENYYVPWNFYNWANTSFSYIAFYRNGNINYRIARAISSANFIVEYTKTSESES